MKTYDVNIRGLVVRVVTDDEPRVGSWVTGKLIEWDGNVINISGKVSEVL